MDFIKPTEIDDDLFSASNVPENDYQEWESGTSYSTGATVVISTSGVHKIYECLVAQSSGLTPDVLDDDCSSLTGWTSGDTYNAVSEVSPAGQFRFDTNVGSPSYPIAERHRTLSAPPDTFTLEVKTYFDLIGPGSSSAFEIRYSSATWLFRAVFNATKLLISKAGPALGEVGTDIVKSGSAAAWQTWRFQVNKTTESTATVEVFLKEAGGLFVSQGTVDCDYEVAGSSGLFILKQMDFNLGNRLSHVDYIKIATGSGSIENINDSPVSSQDWLEIGPTNRWACFDGTIGNQSTQAESMLYILVPGAVDAIALLNLESSSVEIDVVDEDDDLVTNGDAWTGATGTTQPNSWDKVATPADYAIDGGMLKITTDAVNEGCSQTIAVSAATEYQLLGKYKNTADDIAQIAIYDVTNAAAILATTDLASSTVESVFSHVFTTPAGCVSVRISIMGKAIGDIVWFDDVILAPTEYSETVTTGASKTDLVKLDLPEHANALLTVKITNTGATAKVGEIIVGEKTYLGAMRYSPSISITDYSKKEVDSFGHYSIVERTFAKRMQCSLIIQNTSIDEIVRLLTVYRATELVWVGSENYNSLIVYGFYKDFQVVFARPTSSDCALEIEGLT